MRTHNGRATASSLFALAVVVALAGCAPTSDGTGTAGSDEPSVSVEPSPTTHPPTQFTERFDSPLHGLSIGYPSGWRTRAATEPWGHGELAFDAPDVDVIFHPTLRDDLYFAVVSEPLGGTSGHDWVIADLRSSEREICPWAEGNDYELDGAWGWIGSCDSHVAGGHRRMAVATATRGYITYL